LRAVVERLRALVFRAGVLRAAAPLALFAVDARDFVADDLALVVDLRAGDFRALDLGVPVERAELRFVELALLVPASSSAHLPERTRCAASATASAISDPSFEALVTIVVAAACAVSAASRPASRILRRAAGLALIAAAAAARPAASISRLIAALASLSSVSFPPPLFLLDLAIATSRCFLAAKTLQMRNGSVSTSEQPGSPAVFDCPGTLKGTVAKATIPSNMVSGRK
jgi:hypothetical protein